MTCPKFRHCLNYRRGAASCDCTGEGCRRFAQKCLFLVYTEPLKGAVN